MNDYKKYEIENGQIWLAADGGHYGHVVIDVKKFATVDDVVVLPFTENGLATNTQRIDAFKLAQVRYYKSNVLPDWFGINLYAK